MPLEEGMEPYLRSQLSEEEEHAELSEDEMRVVAFERSLVNALSSSPGIRRIAEAMVEPLRNVRLPDWDRIADAYLNPHLERCVYHGCQPETPQSKEEDVKVRAWLARWARR